MIAPVFGILQENVTRIVYVNKSHHVDAVAGSVTTSVASTAAVQHVYDQNSSDSSSMCAMNNVLPPIGYDYQQHNHHVQPMAGLIGPAVPPPVYGTSAADEDHHQYQAAVDAGGSSVGGGGGGSAGGGSTGCYAQTDVKPSTRVRSYESEKGTYTIISF